MRPDSALLYRFS